MKISVDIRDVGCYVIYMMTNTANELQAHYEERHARHVAKPLTGGKYLAATREAYARLIAVYKTEGRVCPEAMAEFKANFKKLPREGKNLDEDVQCRISYAASAGINARINWIIFKSVDCRLVRQYRGW